MNVIEAAEKLKMSAQTLRLGLREGAFPFGTAFISTKAENSKIGKDRWTYVINSERLDIYLKGDDMHG